MNIWPFSSQGRTEDNSSVLPSITPLGGTGEYRAALLPGPGGYRGLSGTSGASGYAGISGFSGVSSRGFSGFSSLSGSRIHKNPLEVLNEISQRYKAVMTFEELEFSPQGYLFIGDDEKRQLERLGRQLGFSMRAGEKYAEYGSRMFDFLCKVTNSDTPIEIEQPKSRYDIIRDEA